MFVTLANFTGKYELHTGMYDTNKIQDYIDKYEPRYLRQLLGVTLYNEFVSDIDASNNMPKSPNFLKIFNPLDEDVFLYQSISSEGIISMLTGFIYFEYAKDLIMQQTTFGGVQQKAENSVILNTLQTLIYDRYNESIKTYNAIQTWLSLNFNTPTGQAVDFTFLGGNGTNYVNTNNLQLTQLSGSALTVTLLTGGTGYTTGTGLATTGGSGTLCTVDIVENAGIIQSILIDNRGQNYTALDVLTIVQGAGVGATFRIDTATPISNGTVLIANMTATPIGGILTRINLIGGTGYTVGTNISTSGGTGTGCTVNITTVDNVGEITGLTILQSGTGYVIGDILTVNAGNGDATFEVDTISNGEIINLIWVNYGHSWKIGDVFLVDGGGNDTVLIALTYVGIGDFTKYNGIDKLYSYWI